MGIDSSRPHPYRSLPRPLCGVALLQGVNPVPLSFRTNTTMLLMKSSRPSGECAPAGRRGCPSWGPPS